MYRNLLLAIFGCLFVINTALGDTATFKDLENNVYDVQELTKMGSDYSSFSQHVTTLGLVLGRYKREMNQKEPATYEKLITEAAENFIKALENWRKALSSPTSDESTNRLITKSSLFLRDFDIKQAQEKISQAEALKNK